MKSLKIEADFSGEVSLITFKDENGKTIFKSEKSGDFVSNSFAKVGNMKEMQECAESLLKVANVILGEKE